VLQSIVFRREEFNRAKDIEVAEEDRKPRLEDGNQARCNPQGAYGVGSRRQGAGCNDQATECGVYPGICAQIRCDTALALGVLYRSRLLDPVKNPFLWPVIKKQKQNRGRGGAAEPTKSMANCSTEVCVESSNFFYFEAPEIKQTSSKLQSPSRPGDSLPALWLRRSSVVPGGSIEIRRAGSERATGTCFCIARAALFFACVRPPPQKNRKTGRSKKKKGRFMFYVLYRPSP
jgi:hypothetical protein